jgi:hypothetical protein
MRISPQLKFRRLGLGFMSFYMPIIGISPEPSVITGLRYASFPLIKTQTY